MAEPVFERDAVQQRGPVLESVVAAQQATSALFEQSRLRDLGHRIATECARLGVTRLWASSMAGERLLAASIVLSDRPLGVWESRDNAVPLILDGVVAGMAGVALAAAQLRRMGATEVEALIVGRLGGTPLRVEGVTRVIVLQESVAGNRRIGSVDRTAGLRTAAADPA
jgi:HPt (histidine-containing phosphotransfer) domain-containing protein